MSPPPVPVRSATRCVPSAMGHGGGTDQQQGNQRRKFPRIGAGGGEAGPRGLNGVERVGDDDIAHRAVADDDGWPVERGTLPVPAGHRWGRELGERDDRTEGKRTAGDSLPSALATS